MSFAREPAVIIAAISAFASAVLKALQLLGILEWNGDQIAAISLVVDTGLFLFAALFIRGNVTPTADPRLPAGPPVNGGPSLVRAS